MNYQKIITTILLICSFCWCIQAQQLSVEDILLEPSDLLKGELAAGTNAAFQYTKGDLNTTSISQTHEGGIESNLIRTLQVGNSNTIDLTQRGSGNQIVVLQEGNDNTYKLLQEGALQKSLVIQRGNSNEIIQELTNGSSVSTEFIQEGDANRIEHIVSGVSNQSFKLTQKGNGLKVIVNQSGN